MRAASGVIDAQVRAPAAERRPARAADGLEPSSSRVRDSALLDGVDAGAYAYFVHSYAAPAGRYACAVADYGGEFAAAIEQDNFFGTQFHPERSAAVGARSSTIF